MAREEDFIDESINIYIDYDYLTAEQLQTILAATNGIYQELVKSGIFDDFRSFDFPDYHFTRFLEVPLCVEHINTGNSINTKFSLENRFFPSFEIENGDTIKIALPKWSGALVIASYILSYGMDKYEQYLNIKIKELEKTEKESRLNEEKKKEIQEQSAKLQEIKNQPNNSTYINIQKNYYVFQSQIQQANIKVVEVNGVEIKRDSTEQNSNY